MVVMVGGGDGERRPWHYTYVCSIERRLIMTVRYLNACRLIRNRPPPLHRHRALGIGLL